MVCASNWFQIFTYINICSKAFRLVASRLGLCVGLRDLDFALVFVTWTLRRSCFGLGLCVGPLVSA